MLPGPLCKWALQYLKAANCPEISWELVLPKQYLTGVNRAMSKKIDACATLHRYVGT